jgi:exodeoxyribonuclease VII small subunit
MSKPAPTNESSSSDQPSFEAALARLEQIVRQLEEGDIGLAEALQRYEEGVSLLRKSYELLQRAERRIEILSGVDAEGNPIIKPFDDTATVDRGDPARRRARRRTTAETPRVTEEPNPLFGEPGIDEPC